MGHVALNAGYYLLAKLGMHVMAEFEAHDLFDVDQVEVKEGARSSGIADRACAQRCAERNSVGQEGFHLRRSFGSRSDSSRSRPFRSLSLSSWVDSGTDASRILIVPSLLPLARRLPSGLNARQVTSSVRHFSRNRWRRYALRILD
jgi:hypothetical protein